MKRRFVFTAEMIKIIITPDHRKIFAWTTRGIAKQNHSCFNENDFADPGPFANGPG